MRYSESLGDNLARSVFTVESLKQQYVLCPSHVRETYLYHLLRNPPESILHLRRGANAPEKRKALDRLRLTKHDLGMINKAGKRRKVTDDDFNPTQPPPTIIFVQTSSSAAYLETLLRELGFRATSLHSKLGQPQRLASLDLFRGFIIPILICTDVGARGLDMDGVGMVINWDLPRSPKEVDMSTELSPKIERSFQTAEEIYLHRVGRTARMGRGGVAISFVTERRWDEPTLRSIETRISEPDDFEEHD
jgi:ATP-dependent RNA helicase DDX49/DBP8